MQYTKAKMRPVIASETVVQARSAYLPVAVCVAWLMNRSERDGSAGGKMTAAIRIRNDFLFSQ